MKNFLNIGAALALLGLIGISECLAASTPPPADEPAEHKQTLSYSDAIILGLVEGATEFLPISSTGHLILTNHYLGLNQDIPVGSELAPITLKEAADAYVIIIQIGAIAAVLLIYWGKVLSIVLGFLGKSREGLILGRNLLIAFIPAPIFGLTLESTIDRYLFNSWPVVIALIVGAVIMIAAEKWRARQPPAQQELKLHEMSMQQSLLIGLMQCLALWPGTSRSMVTIVGGYLVGLTPCRSAEFSFLLGLITLTGAAVYKGARTGSGMIHAFGWTPVLLGCLVAAVSAAIAVKWLVAYLGKHGLLLFAMYRIALAALVILLLP